MKPVLSRKLARLADNWLMAAKTEDEFTLYGQFVDYVRKRYSSIESVSDIPMKYRNIVTRGRGGTSEQPPKK